MRDAVAPSDPTSHPQMQGDRRVQAHHLHNLGVRVRETSGPVVHIIVGQKVMRIPPGGYVIAQRQGVAPQVRQLRPLGEELEEAGVSYVAPGSTRNGTIRRLLNRPASFCRACRPEGLPHGISMRT